MIGLGADCYWDNNCEPGDFTWGTITFRVFEWESVTDDYKKIVIYLAR